MVLSEQLGLTRHTWTPHCTLASVNGCENSMHTSSYIGFYPRKEKYSRKVRVRMANCDFTEVGSHSFVINHFAVGNLLFGQSLRFTECILDTIVF